MIEFDELLNSIDISNIKSEEEVRSYYSILIDFFSAHRKVLLKNKKNNIIKNQIINNEINTMTIDIYNQELKLNTIYNLYLNKLLSLLDSNNYKEIYKLGIIIINNYSNNIRFFQEAIRKEKLKLKNIYYNSNINKDSKDFNDYIKEKYENIKSKKI